MTTHPPRQSDRSFGLMFTAVFAAVSAIAWMAFDAVILWPLWCAGVFLLVALGVPGLLLPLNRLWSAFAAKLSWFNNYVLLGLFCLVFVWPLGLVMRAFGWDPMQRHPKPAGETYWVPVRRQVDRETLHDLF